MFPPFKLVDKKPSEKMVGVGDQKPFRPSYSPCSSSARSPNPGPSKWSKENFGLSPFLLPTPGRPLLPWSCNSNNEISSPITPIPHISDYAMSGLFGEKSQTRGAKSSDGMEKKESVSLPFSDDLIYSLRAIKRFEDNSPVTSMSFSPNGEYLTSSSENDKICTYNMTSGTIHKSIYSKKYGVDLISFKDNNSIIHSSTKIDDTVRYLNIETNQYIRYFPGHSKMVTQLKINPATGMILSAGLDQRMFLWDIRSPNCQGLLNMKGVPVADFDPEGLIFAVSLNSKTVKLYDLRSFDKGPFSTFKVEDVFLGEFVSTIKFSPNGLSILIHSNEPMVHIVNAFDGSTVKVLDDLNNKGLSIDVSYSPDGSYIFAGSWNGDIHIWKASTGEKICIFKNVHSPNCPTRCVQHNPKYMTLASANDMMVFWNPMIHNYNYIHRGCDPDF